MSEYLLFNGNRLIKDFACPSKGEKWVEKNKHKYPMSVFTLTNNKDYSETWPVFG